MLGAFHFRLIWQSVLSDILSPLVSCGPLAYLIHDSKHEGISMTALKEAALGAINNLPDNADLDDILEEIIYHAKILRGLEDVRAGRVKPLEQVRTEILGPK